MKKTSVLAACGLGALVATGLAAPSNAESTAPVAGNLQHTTVKYWCDKGTPNFVFAVRALGTPEKTVSVAYQGTTLVKLGPVTKTQPVTIFAVKNMAGRTLPLTVTGDTTKSSFPITVSVPKTCAGLPNSITSSAGSSSSSSSTTASSSSTTKPAVPATSSTPATVPTSKPSVPVEPSAPATTPSVPVKPGQGPKVDTDYVPTQQNSSTELALGAFGLAAAGAGSVLVARRGSKR